MCNVLKGKIAIQCVCKVENQVWNFADSGQPDLKTNVVCVCAWVGGQFKVVPGNKNKRCQGNQVCQLLRKVNNWLIHSCDDNWTWLNFSPIGHNPKKRKADWRSALNTSLSSSESLHCSGIYRNAWKMQDQWGKPIFCDRQDRRTLTLMRKSYWKGR